MVGLLGALICACSTTPEQPPAEPLVFPPPPDKARFVFERMLMFSDNVEQPSRFEGFKRFATGESRKLRGLVKPFDVAAHHGRIYVSDSVQRAVLLFDIPGGHFVAIGTEKPGVLEKPLGIDTAPNGDLYVCDTTAKRVMIYDADGNYLRAIDGKTLFSRPSDVAVDRSGERVYVVDTGGVNSEAHAVYVFDNHTGAHIATIGERGSKEGQFNLPVQATVGPDDTLYVVDKGNFRVQALTPDGKFKLTFGQAGRAPGDLFSPKGIATDADGNIYVVDTAFGNFQIFDPRGRLLLFVGERGEAGAPAKYMLPAGIDVDEDGRVYVVDQFFRKVDVYRPAALAPDAGFVHAQ